MKAVKKTGLVPVKHRGMVIGVPPVDAIKGVKSGEMELVPIRADIETIDVIGFDPDVAIKVVEPIVSAEGIIEIPEDWRTIHGVKRSVIAKKILGLEMGDKLPVADGQDVADAAIAVIEAELARRSAEASNLVAATDTDGNSSENEAPVVPVSTETNLETSATEPSA